MCNGASDDWQILHSGSTIRVILRIRDVGPVQENEMDARRFSQPMGTAHEYEYKQHKLKKKESILSPSTKSWSGLLVAHACGILLEAGDESYELCSFVVLRRCRHGQSYPSSGARELAVC
jgi:hypothetical protein